MRLIDSIAAYLGYGKAQGEPLSQPRHSLVERSSVQSVPEPADFGLPDDVLFDVSDNGIASLLPVTWDDLIDFVDASGLDVCGSMGKATLTRLIAGNPFEGDGGTTVFKPHRGHPPHSQKTL